MLNDKVRRLANFTWGIADLLRHDFRQTDYGRIILPFTILRRLDQLLEPTRADVIAVASTLPDGIDGATKDMILFDAAGAKVYNTTELSFARIKGQNPGDLHRNLVSYVMGFSAGVKDIFVDKFLFTESLKRLSDAEILWHVFEEFTKLDVSPTDVSNLEMGYVFEELIRRFSEQSNETAGEHFTPREVIHLIVELLLANDKALTGRGVIRTVYDPACGTGGILSICEAEIKELNESVRVELYGQEINPESYAICRSDMLITGHDPEQIAFGNTLTQDAHKNGKFHYLVSNPPYGVDWKKYADPIKVEARDLGHEGRFGAGLPRISDGQLLFLQHMIGKMRDDELGSQIGIVMNGSPLFTGGAGSGESEIRRWLFEQDLVAAIIALPTDLFYNTGIQTYAWILTNRKEKRRQGKVQLIDASADRFWRSMRKNLGSKRREIHEAAREEIVRMFDGMLNGSVGWGEYSKIFDTADFGYREIRVERPLRLVFQVTPEGIAALCRDKALLKLDTETREALIDCVESRLPTSRINDRPAFENALAKALKGAGIKIGGPVKKAILAALSARDEQATVCLDDQGAPEADLELRDYELVPLKEHWVEFFGREVTPYADDAWVDQSYRDHADKGVGRVGYEINFNRYFYRYKAPRPLEELSAELKTIEASIAALLQDVAS
ncbi:SAM-dependent DNA methyltransferase [Sphingomonas populi]|uniref:site-specific DNA-methyltransferase (adenine-specific) n=1 Tax=Sphingomonas populi TaxID=2484750 RepID=A0A4Q6Y579_9SPHN|nr:class I SAM-dependent DNA methyltransferase [Sphingomonas populi]RZF64336.1 SAM-dependent DNA methyltransferase [Sphingomonas populi]